MFELKVNLANMPPLPPSHDIPNIKFENFEKQMVRESSEIEVLTNTCGEFYLETEWEG